MLTRLACSVERLGLRVSGLFFVATTNRARVIPNQSEIRLAQSEDVRMMIATLTCVDVLMLMWCKCHVEVWCSRFCRKPRWL